MTQPEPDRPLPLLLPQPRQQVMELLKLLLQLGQQPLPLLLEPQRQPQQQQLPVLELQL